MADIPPLYKAYLDARAKKMQEFPADIVSKWNELVKQAITDEEYKQEMVAEGEQTFLASDTDNDGILNFAEFCDFSEKTKANMSVRLGVDHSLQKKEEVPEDVLQFVFEAHRFSQNECGVTLDDLKQSWVFMEAFYKASW